jgi:hypothetical protein
VDREQTEGKQPEDQERGGFHGSHSTHAPLEPAVSSLSVG